MDNKFCSDFADCDSLDFVSINPPFDGVSLEVVDSLICDKYVPLLLLFVVIKLEDSTAEEDMLSVFELLCDGLICGTV